MPCAIFFKREDSTVCTREHASFRGACQREDVAAVEALCNLLPATPPVTGDKNSAESLVVDDPGINPGRLAWFDQKRFNFTRGEPIVRLLEMCATIGAGQNAAAVG